jgi:quinoprotein dehydrogenase-associated probable ABC transporter substrate-binding protein
MFLRCLSLALLCTSAFAAELRVCAEPDNLPFSRADESGFENRIARILAHELNVELRYEWQPQRRAFVRKTLGSDLCDAWMGVPTGFERVLTTRPYYRSTYVFVYGKRPLQSFDDPALGSLRVGVQLPGNDGAATPAGHALAAKGAIENVRGYLVYGEHPAVERIVDDVARGELDAGVVWGPAAGFFAHTKNLGIAPAAAPKELEGMPFQFSISIGVRRGNAELRDQLNAALERRKRDIDAVLAEFAVPLVK